MSDKLQVQADGRDFRDCGDYDMQIDQALLLNERMGPLPDVYYSERQANGWSRIILNPAYGMYILYITEIICHCCPDLTGNVKYKDNKEGWLEHAPFSQSEKAI